MATDPALNSVTCRPHNLQCGTCHWPGAQFGYLTAYIFFSVALATAHGHWPVAQLGNLATHTIFSVALETSKWLTVFLTFKTYIPIGKQTFASLEVVNCLKIFWGICEMFITSKHSLLHIYFRIIFHLFVLFRKLRRRLRATWLQFRRRLFIRRTKTTAMTVAARSCRIAGQTLQQQLQSCRVIATTVSVM